MGCPTECIDPAYEFRATAHVRPEAESLTVGDTLWIESSTSTTMRDRNSGQDIPFGNAANFGTTTRVAELKAESDTLLDAVNRFTYFALAGKAYTVAKLHPARSLACDYAQVGNQYKLQLGLVCRQKGIFSLFIGDAVNVRQQGKTVCQGANIQLGFDNADKHTHYLQDLYFKTYPIEEATKQSSYCFAVQ